MKPRRRGFSKAELRIGRSVRRHEASPQFEATTAIRSRVVWCPRLAVVGTTKINKATASAFGIGAATLQVLKADGTWAPMPGGAVTIMNPSTAQSINPGALVIVLPVDGHWLIDFVLCGQTSP